VFSFLILSFVGYDFSNYQLNAVSLGKVLSVVLARYTLPVFTGREYGRPTPVN